jgi:hypothetical protein
MKRAVWIGVIGVVATLANVASIVGSAGYVFPPCRSLPEGVSVLTRLNDAPQPLVQALAERIGDIVPAGAPFDATDVIRVGKNRRLIFIWTRGTRWVVATERGGYGYGDPVFAFEASEDSRNVTLVRQEAAFRDTVCSTASSLLVFGYPPYVPAVSAK